MATSTFTDIYAHKNVQKSSKPSNLAYTMRLAQGQLLQKINGFPCNFMVCDRYACMIL